MRLVFEVEGPAKERLEQRAGVAVGTDQPAARPQRRAAAPGIPRPTTARSQADMPRYPRQIGVDDGRRAEWCDVSSSALSSPCAPV